MTTISCIVCTHNRCNSLEKTLLSITQQEYPRDGCEIIVVDNNSTDQTRSVVARVSSHSPFGIRYLFEGKTGLSRARNAGIKKAAGEIIAFIDDDARADNRWLLEISDTFKTEAPAPGCVGGQVLPDWESVRPEWFTENLSTYLSITSLGDSARWLKEDEFPCGTNIAFKKRALLKTGCFNSNFGRTGKSLISGEEILTLKKLRNDGDQIFYQPKAVVYHSISSERANKQWLLKRALAQGRTDFRMDKFSRETKIQEDGLTLLRVAMKVGKAILDMSSKGTHGRLQALIYLTTITGFLYEKVHYMLLGKTQDAEL